MEKTTIIIVGLCVAVILLGGYLFYSDYIIPKINQVKYEYYVNGSIYGSEQIILKINQEQLIPVIIQEGNSTSVQWYPISQFCGK